MLIIALGLPLTINLRERARTELENRALITTGAIAAVIGHEPLEAGQRRLDDIVQETELQDARALVVDERGVVVADSAQPSQVGENYARPGRPEIGEALRGVANSEIRPSQDLGHDIIATAVPIFDEDGTVLGAVRITQDAQVVDDTLRRTTLGLLAIGGAGLIAGLLLAFGLAGSLSRPLTRLARAARGLGSGDLSSRAGDVGGASEIEQLGRSFDEMADRLERTVRAQREFVANASHQLRTPLTGMKLRLESAIDAAENETMRRQLEAAEREVDRLSGIVNQLLEVSREIEEGTPAHVDLDDAVARAITRWTDRANQMDSTLRVHGESGSARADPSDLDQILDNLLDNAISYAPGEITIESGSQNGQEFVAVRDQGPGIPEGEIALVTERFYRGRGAPSGGSGLGLAIARDLAEKWGGSLSVTSTAGEGTRVEVRLRAVPH